MSKKTQNIKNTIEALNELHKKLEDFNKDKNFKELEEIQFNMNQQLKLLDFWYTSLYQFNGKSKSTAKKRASATNGKKGGRPPRHIAQLKTRRTYLEETLIPSTQRKLDLNEDDPVELQTSLNNYQNELASILQELDEWKASRL